MWRIPGDDTPPVITAAGNISSPHRGGVSFTLPDTAVLFYMSGMDTLLARPDCQLITPELPRFLYKCPVYRLGERLCFLDGGRGAPQAADTVETLAALGVKRIVAAGLFGALSEDAMPGSLLLVKRAYIEEGTSLHYLGADAVYAEPDAKLHQALRRTLRLPEQAIVSTDAVYRQTFRKEQSWREIGAVGVDMETSAVLSVSRCVGVQAAAVLMASDLHPMQPGEKRWSWHMTPELRRDMVSRVTDAVLALDA